MARTLNTPPVEVQMQTSREVPMRLSDRVWIAASTIYVIAAWWLLIEVVS